METTFSVTINPHNMTSQEVIKKPVRKHSTKTHAEVVASIKQDQLNRARGLLAVMAQVTNE